jgi:AcrR family transcriptional regulator
VPKVTSAEAAPADGARTGARALKAERTRARLLDAAKTTFEQQGFLASSVADIVKRAGVSHGLFYHYFSSREDVLREIVTQADAQLWAPMHEVILDRSSGASPADRIRAAMAAFLSTYRDQAAVMRVVEEVSRYDEHIRAARLERLAEYRDEMSESIRVLQRRDLADRNLDPTIIAMILGSITMRFPEMWMVEHLVDCSFDDAVEHLATTFIGVLGLKDSRHPTGA